MAVTAYVVRGLQLLLGSSKRAIIERAEEMGDEDDAIPLSELPDRTQHTPATTPLDSGANSMVFAPELTADLTSDLAAPAKTQDPSQVRGTGGPPVAAFEAQTPLTVIPAQQDTTSLTRPQRWAAFTSRYLDLITYTMLFIFVGIPVYYATGYAMPAQLTFNILAYFVALALPAQWRKVLHPVLVSSAITLLGIWILGLIRGDSLYTTLALYKTGTTYQELWDGKKGLQAPGAGDIFGTVLDASIVALALPMFQYRNELKQHFFAIIIPNVAISVASLFGYPALCYAIGISPQRSLAFSARSLTLALATPAVRNLGGDLSTVAALCIMSGIAGALIGPRILQWLRIPDGKLSTDLTIYFMLISVDDYVTRGVTLGGNSSAIATALLLVTDPRAAALSSLSMSLFGTITIILTSIPPIVKAIDALVGL